jgi:phospholipid/cholesterol/gamma-HCH transport system permease protein
MKQLLRIVANTVGKKFIAWATGAGRVTNLFTSTMYWISRGAIDVKNTVSQMIETGWNSLPVIALTSFFTGMVLALQTGASSRNVFNEPIFVGTIVGFSLVRELGPVLTAVVVAGRVGAAVAAELGTMKVTEQIDALYTLGTNPARYLAVPRFLAFLTMLPMLTIIANIIGVFGGLFVTVQLWNIPSTVYWDDIFNYMDLATFAHGFIKSFFFAGIIVTTACYKGFTCEGGAEGVGKATTSAVMISTVLILISDYFLGSVLVSFRIS